jgi:small subunit ribosomal protein S17
MSEEVENGPSQAQPAEGTVARGRRQVKVGTVVSAKMQKTVVVTVDRPVMHRLYQRSLKRSSRFMAHDEENTCREGDLVELQSTRPLSRGKRWKVSKILKRAEG